MSSAQINLIVLRSPDIDRAVRCYEALGLVFMKHRHGNGPEHYACEQEDMVFEIYPSDVDTVRVGFSVTCLADMIERWTQAGGVIFQQPRDSEWGRRAVVTDSDGRKVELVERHP